MLPPVVLLLLGLTNVFAFDSSEIRMLGSDYASSKRSDPFGRVERSLEDGMGSPLIRFGKRNPDGAPLIRFGRAPEASPLIRFGKRSPDGAPLIRFGRSDAGAPLIRFGRSSSDYELPRDSRAAPLIRFGRK